MYAINVLFVYWGLQEAKNDSNTPQNKTRAGIYWILFSNIQMWHICPDKIKGITDRMHPDNKIQYTGLFERLGGGGSCFII